MIRNLTARETRILILCIMMILAYIGYNGAFRPLKDKKLKFQNEIDRNERLLEKNLRTIQKGKAYESGYNDIIKKFKQNDSDERTMSSILSEIEKIANEREMSISKMKPQRVKRSDFYNVFSVSLSIDGSLSDIIGFLHVLQDETHLFDIDQIRFHKVSPRTENLKCRLEASQVLIPLSSLK